MLFESSVESPCCKGEGYGLISSPTRTVDFINPLIFPKITTKEFGCSEMTYVIHLTNLITFLSRLSLLLNNIIPFDYCLESFYNEPDQCRVTFLLDYAKSLSEMICTTSRGVSKEDDSRQNPNILKDIKDNICYAASPDMIKDEIQKIKIKYNTEIQPLNLFRIIAKMARGLVNEIGVLPELKWFILTACLDVHDSYTQSLNIRLLDILILLCTLEALECRPLVLENGKRYHMNPNCINILRICLYSMYDDKRFYEYDPYLKFFNRLERLFSSTLKDMQEGHLLRAYIFAFSADHDFLDRYDQFCDRLSVKGDQHKNISNENEEFEYDKIIYGIFLMYDKMFTNIINRF